MYGALKQNKKRETNTECDIKKQATRKETYYAMSRPGREIDVDANIMDNLETKVKDLSTNERFSNFLKKRNTINI